MKIPTIPFYKVERAVRMLPIIKEVFASAPSESEPDSLKLVRQLKDALHDKKAEICALREKIEELEAILEDYRSAIGAGPTKEDS